MRFAQPFEDECRGVVDGSTINCRKWLGRCGLCSSGIETEPARTGGIRAGCLAAGGTASCRWAANSRVRGSLAVDGGRLKGRSVAGMALVVGPVSEYRLARHRAGVKGLRLFPPPSGPVSLSTPRALPARKPLRGGTSSGGGDGTPDILGSIALGVLFCGFFTVFSPKEFVFCRAPPRSGQFAAGRSALLKNQRALTRI